MANLVASAASTTAETLVGTTATVASLIPVKLVAPTYSSQRWAVIILASVLFLVLSPGFILTIPQNNVNYCQNELGLSGCNMTNPNSSTGHCKKCLGYWTSGYTSSTAIWIHGLLFFSLLFVLGITFIRA